MEHKLSKCPFCGRRKVMVVWIDVDGAMKTFVECQDCKARGPELAAMSQKIESKRAMVIAEQMWNDRHVWDDSCCPRCGWESNSGSPENVMYGQVRENVAASMMDGGVCSDWDETWRCERCGQEFTFENSSY